MRKVYIWLACLLMVSCAKKELQEVASDNQTLTIATAKAFYERASLHQKLKIANSTTDLRSVVEPDWKNAVKFNGNNYELVEAQLFMSRTEIVPYRLNGEKAEDDMIRAKFSFASLIVYKNTSDTLTSAIVTYIPDKKYISGSRKKMRSNRFGALDVSFFGYMEFRHLNGEPYRLVRIENGKTITKYRLTTYAPSVVSDEKQTMSQKQRNSMICTPICTPILGMFCAGPGGPGTGFEDEDLQCWTDVIGEHCTMVCFDDGNGPDPGTPGGGTNGPTPGVFGINGTNKIVPAANIPALKAYVLQIGYRLSDEFVTVLTHDGTPFPGKIFEVYNTEGKVISAFFTPDQGSSTFPAGNYYNVGNGNAGNHVSDENSYNYTSIFGSPMYPGITYHGGVGSDYSTAYEEITGLSNTDAEYLDWYNETQVGYPKQAAPTYDDMYSNYPKDILGGDMPAAQVYALVGGDVYTKYLLNQTLYANACALRVSRALNYSGITIPNVPEKTIQGADGKYYFVSSIQLYKFLKETFADVPKVVLDEADGGNGGVLFRGKLGTAKGIYLMQPKNPQTFGAYGHATLWKDGAAIGGHDYLQARGGVVRVVVWKLN